MNICARWTLPLVLLPALFGAPPAMTAEPTEGIEYQRVTPAQPTETGGQLEVLELFWYGCPHCYHLEPVLNQWRKTLPPDVTFRRMPAVLGDTWLPHARAYYAAEALGVLERIHTPLFQAMHEHKKPLQTVDALADFFASQGVSKEEFTRAFNSFTVESKARRAVAMTKRYGVDGVPAFIVDGKYRTASNLAGGQDEMMMVLGYLVQKAQGDRKATGK